MLPIVTRGDKPARTEKKSVVYLELAMFPLLLTLGNVYFSLSLKDFQWHTPQVLCFSGLLRFMPLFAVVGVWFRSGFN